MNEKQLKGLLDLVVKTVNDLSKHHAGETLELVSGEMDERAVEFTKNLDEIATAVNKLDDDQTTSYEELTEAIKKIENIDDDINEKIDSLGKDSTERQDILRDMCIDLGKSIDTIVEENKSRTPNHVIDELQESVKLLNELADKDNATHGTKFYNLSASIVKITEELGKVHDNVELIKGAPEKLIEVTQAIGEVAESLDTVERAHEEAIDSIVTDMVKANDHIGKLKQSLIGYGDDLRELSDAMHKRADSADQAGEDFNEALIVVHGLIKAGEENYSTFTDSLNSQHELLIEKFNELKNESFLSADKIDMKFAEMKLSLVELDVERENRIKVAVSEQGDEILAQLSEKFDKYRKDIGEGIDADIAQVEKDVHEVLNLKAQNIMNSKSWVPGDWSEGAVCRNRGGLWQAVRDTDAEPSVESGDWICGASGIHEAQIIATHATGLNVTVGMEDTLGNVHEIKIPLPKINYIKGTHDPDQEYLYNDSVMKDGCRWVATKDHPEHDPGDEGEDWAVLTMRGPKGHKGNAGDTGPRGLTGEKGNKGDKGAKGDQGDDGVTPEMGEIIKALLDFESDIGGQAIRRARGHWKLGTKYSAGDVANVGKGLFLALRDNDGTKTPTSSTEDWLLLLDASGAGNPSQTGQVTKVYLADSPLLDPPVNGVLEYSNGHLLFTHGDRAALVGSNGIKLDTTVVENTVVETEVYNHVLPANSLHADMRIIFSATGAFSTDSASETMTVRLKIGVVPIHTLVINPANGVDIAWRGIHEGTVRADGASGEFIDFSEFSESGVAPIFSANPLPQTIDTTVENTYSVTVEWGAAKAGNSFACTQGDLTYKH